MISLFRKVFAQLTASNSINNGRIGIIAAGFDLRGPLYFVALIVSIVIVIVCVSVDWARHIQRGWMHWTGVSVCVVSLLLSIGRHAYYSWIRG